MRDDEFEWDDRKAARNFREHGITFEMARLAFDETRTASIERTQTRTRNVSAASVGLTIASLW
jgi:uncharacterized DUF497 family protein